MSAFPRVLVAGATGYLGQHLVHQLLSSGYPAIALARSPGKLSPLGLDESQLRVGEVTSPDSILGCCDQVDVVISCVGITRQKDGLGYMDVDYQANLNLLREAERAGVRQFIYVSAFNALKFQNVRLLQAKERFAKRLLSSEIEHPCVVRPNGFFSDMSDFFEMAKGGRVYLFGNGQHTLNPIHGEDLARFCIDAIGSEERELDVGGPELFTHRQIGELAFAAMSKQSQISCFPDGLRKGAASLCGWLPERWTGAAEFFLTLMGSDMAAPCYGQHHLEDHFRRLVER
ncbi:SDR family oxidoreductase [Ferrimonas sp.]|uniref:SDR family oxidoreductase n=1 Tax=Ferrimonas sp. TaxID=2080861 RepID=UPI003A8FEA6D